MKVLQDENYSKYLKRITLNFFSQTGKVISYIIILIGFGVFGFESGFNRMITIFLFIISFILLAFYISEIFISIISQKVYKNKFITLSVLLIVLVILDLFMLDNNIKYHCLVASLILSVPIILVNIINEINSK